MAVLRSWLAATSLVLLAACATIPPDRGIESPGQPGGTMPPSPLPADPWAGTPSVVTPPAAVVIEREQRALVERLLPAGVKDRRAWGEDLHKAFMAIGLPQEAPLYCAAIAVIEQESSFQADPVVPGLPAIVRRELDARAARFAIPAFAVSAALTKRSPDGRSYEKRIADLRTERELNALFEDMIAEFPFGERLFSGLNPVRTGGPMQVSIAFAEAHARERRYPYPIAGSIRNEVFTRRGGVYFGVAILLDYPAPYTEVVFRFADFNAGRYSSRNAAFQRALAAISGRSLLEDGDLLRYRDGKALAEPSAVEQALLAIADKLRLRPVEIRNDLLLEKQSAFGESLLYRRVFALADARAGSKVARQSMPRIDLKSPKITRKLTTEWFARRVEGRFRSCLERQ